MILATEFTSGSPPWRAVWEQFSQVKNTGMYYNKNISKVSCWNESAIPRASKEYSTCTIIGIVSLSRDVPFSLPAAPESLLHLSKLRFGKFCGCTQVWLCLALQQCVQTDPWCSPHGPVCGVMWCVCVCVWVRECVYVWGHTKSKESSTGSTYT